MRKTTIVVASLLTAMAVSTVKAAETKADLVFPKGKDTAVFKVTLAKGTYEFVASENVKGFTIVKGETPVAGIDGVYALDAGDYEIRASLASAATAEVKATVWGYNKAVLNEAEEVVKKLTNDLSVAINQANQTAYNDDETLQGLSQVGSAISTKINAAALAAGATDEAWKKYVAYVDGTSYLNNGDAEKEIKDLSGKVAAANANYVQYKAALALYETIKNDATKGIKALQAAWNAAGQEIQKANPIEDLKKEVEAIKTDAEAAYGAGTCAGTFSKDALTAKEASLTGAKGSIPAKIEAINSGNASLGVYADVVAKINTAKSTIATKQSELYHFLINNVGDNQSYAVDVNGKDKEVYEDTYAEQLLEIAKVTRGINAVEAKNSKEVGEGYDKAADAQAEIDAALAPLAGIISACKANVQSLRAAYNAKCVELQNTAVANYNAISCVDNPDTKAYYKTKLESLKSANDAIQAYLDKCNAAHDKEYKDYGSKKDEAIKNIAAVTNKINNAKNEEDKYNASKATIKTKQDALGAVKKNVAAAKYECKVKGHEYTYTIGNKFDATIKRIQDEIDAITAANNKSYTVKTNGAWDKEKGAITSAQKFNTEEGSSDNLTLKYYTQTKSTLTVNADKNKKLDEAIGALSDRATELVNNVGAIHVDIVANEAALKALKDKVGDNGDVTNDGNVKGENNKTYTEEINILETALAAENTALKTALALDDDAKAAKNHYEQVKALSTNVSIANDATTLLNSFDTNKANWEQANLDAACEKLLAEANRLIGEADKVVGTEYAAATYGKRANADWSEGDGKDKKDYKALNTTRRGLQTILGADNTSGVKKDVAEASTRVTAHEAKKEDLALLKKVVETLNTDVLGGFNTLGELADRVKAEYAKEIKLNNELNASADAIQKIINGDGLTGAAHKALSIMEQATDGHNTTSPTYKDALQSKVDDAQAKINAYKAKADGAGKIKTSFEAETLYKDYYDQGKTKGYNTLIAEIKVTVDALVDEAMAITANYNAWNNVNDYLTTGKVGKTDKTYQEIINKAKSDLAALYTAAGSSAEAQAYYDGLVTKEENEKTAVGTANENDYKDLKDNKDEALLLRIDESVARLQALAQAAQANEKAYKGDNYLSDKNGQVHSYNAAKKAWEALNAKIAAEAAVDDSHYTNKDKEGWNDQLTSFRKIIETYKESIDKAYATGKAADDAFKANLDDVEKAMATLSASFDGEYAQAVTADNLARKNRFDAAYNALVDTYSTKVKAIAELSRLEIAKGLENELVDVTTNMNIYQYAELIRDLQAKAEKEFNATTTSPENDFYDFDEDPTKNEANTALAKDYNNTINTLADEYITLVNDKALLEYNGVVPGVTGYNVANTAYMVTIGNMVGWDKSVIDANNKPSNADLKAVSNMLDKWEHAAEMNDDGTFKDPLFAAKWENEMKDALASVADLLESGLNASAAAQWAIEKAAYQKLAAEESAEIEKFQWIDPSTGEVHTGDIYSVVGGKKVYEYASLLNRVEAQLKVTEPYGTDFDNYANLHKALDEFSSLKTRNLGTKQKPNNVTHTPTYWNAYDKNDACVNNDKYYNESIIAVDKAAADGQAAIDFANELLSRYEFAVVNAKNAVLNEVNYYRTGVNDAKKAGTSANIKVGSAAANKYIADINFAIEKVKAIALNYEFDTSIKSALNDLQYDYDKASAHMLGSTGTEIEDWKKEIDALGAENEAINDAYKVGKKDEKGNYILVNKKYVPETPENTKDAYLALEKKIGALKSIIKSHSDKADQEAEANMIAELNGALNKINSTIAETNPVHKPVVDAKAKAIEETKDQSAAIKTLVDAAAADKTVLIDYANLMADINALDVVVANNKKYVDFEEGKWSYSDIISSDIADRFEAVKTYLNDIYEIAQYNEKKPSYWEGQYVIDDVEYDNKLDYDKALLLKYIENSIAVHNKKVNEGVMFNAGYAETNKDVIASYNKDINTMWYNASVYNINETLYDVESLANYVGYYLSDNYNKLTWEDYDTFQQKLSDINDAESMTAQFKMNIVKTAEITGETNKIIGKSRFDIDGNPFYDENDDIYDETFAWVNINGVDEYHNVAAKAAKFTEDLKQLQADIKAALFLIGDVNNDLVVDVNDYAKLANIILNDEVETLTGKAFNIADAKCDKEINVSDLAAIVNIIRDNFEAHSKVRDFKSREAAANDQYTVGVNDNVLSIGINNAVAYTGFQMDITLPMGASIVSDELTARAAGQEISINNIGGNTYRVLVMGVDGEAFKGNAGAIANLQLLNMHGTAAVSNAIFTDAYGTSYKLNMGEEATAINGVEAQQSASEMIYSVGGQIKNQVTKGINIIKSNGIVKKMLNK